MKSKRRQITKIDERKSLNTLTGFGHVEPPPNVRELMRLRYELRDKPLCDLTNDELHRLFEIGCDIEFLVPLAIKRLKNDPEILALLCRVLSAEYNWRKHAIQVRALRTIVYHALAEIEQYADRVDRLAQSAALLRSYAGFERSLSVIP